MESDVSKKVKHICVALRTSKWQSFKFEDSTSLSRKTMKLPFLEHSHYLENFDTQYNVLLLLLVLVVLEVHVYYGSTMSALCQSHPSDFNQKAGNGKSNLLCLFYEWNRYTINCPFYFDHFDWKSLELELLRIVNWILWFQTKSDFAKKFSYKSATLGFKRRQ